MLRDGAVDARHVALRGEAVGGRGRGVVGAAGAVGAGRLRRRDQGVDGAEPAIPMAAPSTELLAAKASPLPASNSARLIASPMPGAKTAIATENDLQRVRALAAPCGNSNTTASRSPASTGWSQSARSTASPLRRMMKGWSVCGAMARIGPAQSSQRTSRLRIGWNRSRTVTTVAKAGRSDVTHGDRTQAAPAAGGEALLRLEDDAVALHAMQHAAAVGTDQMPTWLGCRACASSTRRPLPARRPRAASSGARGCRAPRGRRTRRLKASTSKGGLAAEALALHAPEEAPAVMRAGAPFVADVVGGPVLHHDTSPEALAGVFRGREAAIVEVAEAGGGAHAEHIGRMLVSVITSGGSFCGPVRSVLRYSR